MNRRGFLGLVIRALLWFSGTAGVAGLIRFLSYDPEPASTSLYTLELPAAHPVGSITSIPEARVILVRDQLGFFARSLFCPILVVLLRKERGAFGVPAMVAVLGN